ncbi:MAG: hypothetical protein AB1604_03720 [Euryarchaeota archaeon]
MLDKRKRRLKKKTGTVCLVYDSEDYYEDIVDYNDDEDCGF